MTEFLEACFTFTSQKRLKHQKHMCNLLHTAARYRQVKYSFQIILCLQTSCEKIKTQSVLDHLSTTTNCTDIKSKLLLHVVIITSTRGLCFAPVHWLV